MRCVVYRTRYDCGGRKAWTPKVRTVEACDPALPPNRWRTTLVPEGKECRWESVYQRPLNAPANAPAPATVEHWGPAKWAVLHRFTLAPDRPTVAFLNDFKADLPGCCKPDWERFVAASPPPDDPALLFAWGVDRHNDVNRKLKKPTMGVEAARAIYE